MSLMRRTSARVRLTAMAVVVCCFIAGITTLGIRSIKVLERELEELFHVYLLPVYWMTDLRNQTRSMEAALYSSILTDDQGARGAYIGDVGNRLSVMARLTKDYEDGGYLEDFEERTLSEIKRLYGQVNSMVSSITVMVEKGDPGAYSYLNKNLSPLLTEYQNKVRSLSDYAIKSAEEDNRENSEMVKTVTTVTASLSILALLISLATAFFVARSITAPLKVLENQVKEFAQGDLSVSFSTEGHDEITRIGQGLSDMASSIRGAIGAVIKVSEKLKESAQTFSALTEESSASLEETRAGAEQVSQTSENLSASGQEINASVEEVASGAATAATRSGEVAEEVDSAKAAAESSIEAVSLTAKDISMVSREIDSSAKAVIDLAGKAEKIQSIVNDISSIADQTNLLALNAAIEAARAGEHGRGFAVVAEEVRKLAEESNKASHNIADLAASIGQDLLSVREGAKNNQTGASRVKSQVSEVETRIKDILTSLESIAGSTQDVAAVSEEQAASSEEIASTVQDMAERIQGVNETSINLRDQIVEVAQASEQMALGAASLLSLAEQLESRMAFFRMGQRKGIKPL